MRCMAYCPVRAVEANYLLGVAAYLFAALVPTTTALAWLATRIPRLAFLAGIPHWVLESIYAVVALGVAYPIVHLLLRTPWINRFLTLATPTHYYRRYHEPGTGLKDLEGE
jgi:hypothetical protein